MNSNVIFLNNGNIKPNLISYGDQVLLAIFAKSFGRDVWCGNPKQFREAHPTLTEAGCRMMRLLELVEPDEGSPFGHRPTNNLTMQLLLESEMTHTDKKTPDEEDRELLDELIQGSGKPELWEGGKSLSNMLVVLRLAQWSEETNELIPTEWLHISWASVVGIKDN